jgi:PIN domain nuclease of toxin-antitoxin system
VTRLLLDTCVLLWFLANDPRLSIHAKTAIEDPGNERWLSPASLIEIALKVRIGKLTLRRPFAALFPAELTANDIHLLPLGPAQIEPLVTLPLHHRDPFDRLIAGAGLVEGLTLVSADAAFDAYGLLRLW